MVKIGEYYMGICMKSLAVVSEFGRPYRVPMRVN